METKPKNKTMTVGEALNMIDKKLEYAEKFIKHAEDARNAIDEDIKKQKNTIKRLKKLRSQVIIGK